MCQRPVLLPETLDPSECPDSDAPGSAARVPGLMLVFSGERPLAFPVPLVGGAVALGRDHEAFAQQLDPRMSRRHARVEFDGRRFRVIDLASRNGLGLPDLNAEIRDAYGVNGLYDLSRRQASALLDRLKARQRKAA